MGCCSSQTAATEENCNDDKEEVQSKRSTHSDKFEKGGTAESRGADSHGDLPKLTGPASGHSFKTPPISVQESVSGSAAAVSTAASLSNHDQNLPITPAVNPNAFGADVMPTIGKAVEVMAPAPKWKTDDLEIHAPPAPPVAFNYDLYTPKSFEPQQSAPTQRKNPYSYNL